jgi:hypothetical protein
VPWLRAGDTAATHPIVLRAAVGGDDRTVNEVFGFVVRCALQASAHMTDYFVDEGTAWMIGGQHTKRLAGAAAAAGYWTPVEKGGHPGWQLVDDDTFIHMRMRAEVEWDRQRGKDASNPQLVVPVRLRDGDVCRYCGRTVNWWDRKGTRGGTYDHREPGKPATVDTYVVACRGCNSGRKDHDDADAQHPLLPAPERPYYTERSAAWLNSHGHDVTPGPPLAPGSIPPNAAPRGPASSETSSTAQASPSPDLQIRADVEGRESGFAGSGRVGPGQVGSGADPPTSGRKRRRRGGRRNRSPTPLPPPDQPPTQPRGDTHA